ncbi:MAG: lysine--tRNA ligase [Pyrinomonadaceae bacterium]
MSIPAFEEIIEQNDQTEARSEHLDKLRELVGNVYPNRFARSAVSGVEDTITNILKHKPVVEIVAEIKAIVATLAERERPPAEIKDSLNERLKALGNVRIAGRLTVPPRVMGKAGFVHLSDGISRLQIYVRRDDVQGVWNGAEPPASAGGTNAETKDVGENSESLNLGPLPPAHAGGSASGWEIFQLLDHGDFVGVEGYLFITNTGEVSVHVEKLQFLAKAMLPMPDKMHGIADAEIRQRQRYYDLIGSSLQVEHEGMTTREVFERRAKIISSMRYFLEDHGYIEVETPMLTPKATGAAAKPFKTHHNALDIDLYARIAPELYLKRLVVGGFEKVYELNRNFRNEGISYKHNPEFTMLEFYCAYMDVEGMMNFCEELMQQSVLKATGGLTVEYEGKEIDFSRFERMSMKEAIAKRWPEMEIGKLVDEPIDKGWLDDTRNIDDLSEMSQFWTRLRFEEYLKLEKEDRKIENILDKISPEVKPKWKELRERKITNEITVEEEAKKILFMFETFVESKLVQPTFIIDYPKVISPLSKASPENPNIAERFELFINGMEVANGFSELNDPKEQYQRFIEQMSERERGDEEAMIMDEDYIRALSYGMPPAAGIGIGIDRLVMLLTNKHSIRDVILFPHMRPERRDAETGDTEPKE